MDNKYFNMQTALRDSKAEEEKMLKQAKAQKAVQKWYSDIDQLSKDAKLLLAQPQAEQTKEHMMRAVQELINSMYSETYEDRPFRSNFRTKL